MLTRTDVLGALAGGGFIDPETEADALLEAARDDEGAIGELMARRLRGEPLAWITGRVTFCDLEILVDSGVFVPRPQTQAMARRAAELVPADGIGVDLCTGSGAVAAVLATGCPDGSVLATDDDSVAIACARKNGVEALLGDLDEPLPHALRGKVDVLTAVVPYVPSEELHLLPRDVLDHEPRAALDGGPAGTTVLLRAVKAAAAWLRPGGSVVLELGGDQARAVGTNLAALGFEEIRVHQDDDGRDRSIEARRSGSPSRVPPLV